MTADNPHYGSNLDLRVREADLTPTHSPGKIAPSTPTAIPARGKLSAARNPAARLERKPTMAIDKHLKLNESDLIDQNDFEVHSDPSTKSLATHKVLRAHADLVLSVHKARQILGNDVLNESLKIEITR
jgi:hypothetical protein